MEEPHTKYLTKEQTCSKYPFLTMNMLKNILFKNIDGFKDKVTVKLGKRVLIDEIEFLKFMAALKNK